MLVGLCPRKEKLKRTLNTMKEVTMLKNQDRMKRQNMKFKLKKFLLVDVEEEPDEHEYKNGSVVIFGKLVNKIFKKDKITKEDVEGPFELLKGTCKNIIKLEYNMEQCHLALIYKIDWTNPESDRFHHDLSKPLPLTGPPGRKRIPVSYFFNHDLEESMEQKKARSLSSTNGSTKEILDLSLNMKSTQRSTSEVFKASKSTRKAWTNYRQKLMRANELCKFSDDTLNNVLRKLKVILRNNRLDYHNKGIEKYKWTEEDRKRTQKFMDKIENTLKQRRDKTDYRLLVRPK
ncbi:hypothetical protein Tco_1252665 [Tanacetum coccineum]